MTTDHRALADLVEFARLEADTKDVAPWAVVLKYALDHLEMDRALVQWIVTLYNTFDDYGSAFAFAEKWPSLHAWAADPFNDLAADGATYPIRRERRNLHGGRVLKRLDSHAELVGDWSEELWMLEGAVGETAADRFDALCAYLRRVWGVGRQAAFEWAEFQGKVMGHDVMAGHAFLWESQGPRRSLQRIYGNAHPTAEWLDDKAEETQELLRSEGIELELWDFETIICDFNVMRDGRYYPGRHLALLRGEINTIKDRHHWDVMNEAWHAVIPHPWNTIADEVDKDLMGAYQLTGQIITPFKEST